MMDCYWWSGFLQCFHFIVAFPVKTPAGAELCNSFNAFNDNWINFYTNVRKWVWRQPPVSFAETMKTPKKHESLLSLMMSINYERVFYGQTNTKYNFIFYYKLPLTNNRLYVRFSLFVHLTLIFDCHILFTFLWTKKLVWFMTENHFRYRQTRNVQKYFPLSVFFVWIWI